MKNELLNVLVYALALEATTENFERRLVRDLPWLILPDELGSSYSHSRISSDERGLHTLIFPEHPKEDKGKKIKIRTSRVVSELPEEEFLDIDLRAFDEYNWSHPMYCSIRAHLVQDALLEKSLSSLKSINDAEVFQRALLKKAYKRFFKKRGENPLEKESLKHSFSEVYGEEGETIFDDLLSSLKKVDQMPAFEPQAKVEDVLHKMLKETIKNI